MVVTGYKSPQYVLFFWYMEIQDGGELWNAIVWGWVCYLSLLLAFLDLHLRS